MAKQQVLEKEGIVKKVLSNNLFEVILDHNHPLLAYASGKMKTFKIRIIPGDRVKVEMSPYDLHKGRIVYRYK